MARLAAKMTMTNDDTRGTVINPRIATMKHRVLLALACLATLVAGGVPPDAQALEPIRYTLRFPAPHTHYVEVEAAIPSGGRPQVEVYMATWTPGSYLIREYERHVEAVSATRLDARSPSRSPPRIAGALPPAAHRV